MSDFRDLQAKLQQIEESYFSDLDLELQEFRRANKDLPADQLVALAREKYGQEAASLVSDRIEAEYDLADYEASDPQPHMRDPHPSDPNWPHPVEEDDSDEFDQPLVSDETYARMTTELEKIMPGYGLGAMGLPSDKPHQISIMPFNTKTGHEGDDMVFNLETQSFEGTGDHFMLDNPFEGIEEESEITYLKHPEGYEPAPIPERHPLDSFDWSMRAQDDVIQMMKSLEHKMKSQNVWDKGVELAGSEDNLWREIQYEAEDIMDTYRDSGEGIGTSDMNHFVRAVFRQLGEDDIWGWDKPKVKEEGALKSDEEMERDKTNRYAKYNKAVRNVKETFNDWVDDLTAPSDESEHRFDHDPSFSDEEPISRQVKSLLAQGKSVICRISGASGVVYDANPEDGTIIFKDENFGEKVGFDVDSKSGLEIQGNVDHYAIVQHTDESLEEARGQVVEVPPEFRGTDPDNSLGGTSRGVEAFLRDLGPDDSVDTEVVDPETGELLDWPTKGTRRAQGQKEYEKQEKERKEREEKDHEEGFDSPYLYVSGLDKDPENAWQGIHDLKYDREFTDFYNIVWKSVREASGEPFDLGSDAEDWGELDYDVDIDIPTAIKRTDGKKFNKQDRQNFDMVSKIFRAATGNIGVQYVGSSNEGTVARFIPNFM